MIKMSIAPIHAYRVRGTLAEVSTMFAWLAEFLPRAEVTEFGRGGMGYAFNVLLKSDADLITFKLNYGEEMKPQPADVMSLAGETCACIERVDNVAMTAMRVAI